ncbi:hypothetical protein [Enterococcus sp. LJL90]
MNWVEAYINQVIGYLPDGEQAEVKKELYSNIMDMLPDDATEEEIKSVLMEMGNPRKLAEKYRQHPRYLIGPAVYDDYLRTLKIIIPLTAAVGAIIGGIVTYFEQVIEGMSIAVFTEVLSEAIGSGISLALQGLVWTTIGFVIIERTGMLKPKKDDWQVDSLIKTPVAKKIPLGDTIAELVIQIGIIGFLLFANFTSFTFIQTNTRVVVPVFEQSFADFAVMVIILCCLVEVFAIVCKLRYRRWTSLVTISSIISSLVSGLGFIWICSQKLIFSTEISQFLATRDWADGDLLRFFNENSNGQGLPAPIFSGIATICLVATAISIGISLYRYNKQRQVEKNFSFGVEA